MTLSPADVKVFDDFLAGKTSKFGNLEVIVAADGATTLQVSGTPVIRRSVENEFEVLALSPQEVLSLVVAYFARGCAQN